jgi:hypothetical protein
MSSHKNKKFEQLTWDAFSQKSNYNKVRHNMIRARDIMSNSNASFQELPVEIQFDYCVTIVLIATHTALKDINKISIIKKANTESYEYSIDEGFVPPITIEINNKVVIKSTHKS